MPIMFVCLFVLFYISIDELVKHDQNGLLFNDGNELSTQIQVNHKYIHLV